MHFFFNATATTEIYTLSLHDALPISDHLGERPIAQAIAVRRRSPGVPEHALDDTVEILLELPEDPALADARDADKGQDRKSTRLNSSHGYISYAVFCLKKKKQTTLPH